jgi:hypothetical protein
VRAHHRAAADTDALEDRHPLAKEDMVTDLDRCDDETAVPSRSIERIGEVVVVVEDGAAGREQAVRADPNEPRGAEVGVVEENGAVADLENAVSAVGSMDLYSCAWSESDPIAETEARRAE